MGKNKRLPNDTVLAALQLVRGQDRRRAEYKEKVREIISRTGASFVDTQNRAGQPVRVYMPHAKGGTSNTTADKAEAIDQLEQQRDVQIMRAIDAATEAIGADIQDGDTRQALHSTAQIPESGCMNAWKCRGSAGGSSTADGADTWKMWPSAWAWAENLALCKNFMC